MSACIIDAASVTFRVPSDTVSRFLAPLDISHIACKLELTPENRKIAPSMETSIGKRFSQGLARPPKPLATVASATTEADGNGEDSGDCFMSRLLYVTAPFMPRLRTCHGFAASAHTRDWAPSHPRHLAHPKVPSSKVSASAAGAPSPHYHVQRYTV